MSEESIELFSFLEKTESQIIKRDISVAKEGTQKIAL